MRESVRVALIASIVVVGSGCAVSAPVAQSDTASSQQLARETTTLQPPETSQLIEKSTEPPPEPDAGDVSPCVPSTDGVRTVADPENWVGHLEDCSFYDPLWSASMTLVCGSEPGLRVVETYTANTNGRADETVLYSGDATGTLWPLEIGGEFPADRRIAWAIPGFYLGPWQIEEIVDQCDEPSQADPEGSDRFERVLEVRQVDPVALEGTRIMHAEAGVFAISDDGTRVLTNLQGQSGWVLDWTVEPGAQQAATYSVSSDTGDSTGLLLVMLTLWEERSFDRDDTERDFLITDVLQLPAMDENVGLFAYECTLDGVSDIELVVMAETEPFVARPITAWRTNRETTKIESVSIEGIECPNESG